MKTWINKIIAELSSWRLQAKQSILTSQQPVSSDQDLPLTKTNAFRHQVKTLEQVSKMKALNCPEGIGERAMKEKTVAHQINGDSSSWDQAASELRESGRPGKVIRFGSGYKVSYHDEWREIERKKLIEKRLNLAKRLQAEEREREEKERKKRLMLELVSKQKAQSKAEEIERIKTLEHSQREKLLRSISQKVGKSRKIIAHYRHPGSAIEQMSELGVWIIEENGKFFRNHQSKDRLEFAGKQRVVAMGSREEAINFCNWLVSKGWYRDTRLHGISRDSAGFPVTKPPTSEEKIKARKEFITWRERMAKR